MTQSLNRGLPCLKDLKDSQSMSKNYQPNAIHKRMHQIVADRLRTLLHSNPPTNLTQARDVMDDTLATVMYAMRTTVTTTIGSTPGTLAFSKICF